MLADFRSNQSFTEEAAKIVAARDEHNYYMRFKATSSIGSLIRWRGLAIFYARQSFGPLLDAGITLIQTFCSLALRHVALQRNAQNRPYNLLFWHSFATGLSAVVLSFVALIFGATSPVFYWSILLAPALTAYSASKITTADAIICRNAKHHANIVYRDLTWWGRVIAYPIIALCLWFFTKHNTNIREVEFASRVIAALLLVDATSSFVLAWYGMMRLNTTYVPDLIEHRVYTLSENWKWVKGNDTAKAWLMLDVLRGVLLPLGAVPVFSILKSEGVLDWQIWVALTLFNAFSFALEKCLVSKWLGDAENIPLAPKALGSLKLLFVTGVLAYTFPVLSLASGVSWFPVSTGFLVWYVLGSSILMVFYTRYDLICSACVQVHTDRVLFSEMRGGPAPAISSICYLILTIGQQALESGSWLYVVPTTACIICILACSVIHHYEAPLINMLNETFEKKAALRGKSR